MGESVAASRRSMARTRTSWLAASLPGFMACAEPVTPVGEWPDVGWMEVVHIPPRFNPELDLLFVVDDSAGMEAKQAELARSFERLVAQLEFFDSGDDEGLPDLHIGVVSTDMGVGATYAVPTCTVGGKGGLLLGQGIPGARAEPFLRDLSDGEGRHRNYVGTLENAFERMVSLGAKGCEIEQPLAAMHAALGGELAANQGFLRHSAALAVVLVTDEDDCSVAAEDFFAPAVDGDAPEFRCFRRGVTCSDDVVAEGVYTGCRATSDRLMRAPRDYGAILSELKPVGDLVVTGMIGDTDAARIARDDSGALSVISECEGARESYPALRLGQFIDALPVQGERRQVAPQCGAETPQALAAAGKSIRKMLGTRCMDGDIIDIDDAPGVQPMCEVWMERDRSKEALPACTAPPHQREAADAPCYYIDEGGCGDFFGAQLKLFVWWGMDRDGVWLEQPADVHVRASCLVEHGP